MKKINSVSILFTISFITLTASSCGGNATANEGYKVQSNVTMGHSGHDMENMKNKQGGHDTDAKKLKTILNGFNEMPEAGTKAHCLVMNNDFKVKSNSPHSEYKGKTYVFCCPACKPAFDKDPEKYINEDDKSL